MKPSFKALIILLFIPGFILAGNNNTWNGKHTEEKKIQKQYDVNKDALLKINNKYGNIDITTWNKNRIEIEVTITTNGDNESEVRKRLDEITVEFSGSKSVVSAKTIIENQRSSWSLWGGGSKNVNMKINYLIKMPITNSVDLNNNYGAIGIDSLDGNATLSCNYGKFIIGELNGNSNFINFDYTTNSSFGYIKNAQINADYSGFIVEKAEQIAFKGNYSKSEFTQINKLAYDCSYGKVTVGNVSDITGKGNYLSATVNNVSKSLDIKAGYGKISVERLEKTINKVSITSKYTGIKLGFDAGAAFDLSAMLSYASLKGKDLFEMHMERDQSTKKEYRGFYGRKNSGNTIDITSDYGGVSLYQN